MDELSRKRTVVRHDSVTARAISRLSHGVSQLTACSTNAITPRCMFRSRRSKLSTNETSRKRVPFDHRSPTVEQPSPTLDCVQENRSASKRKWQSDKPPSHNNMDVDEVPPSLHSAKASPNSCPVACFDVMASEHCFLPASCQYSDRCRFICSDNFELRATSPSCSSMLSLTASSVDETDSDSSQQQEADAEDEDDKQQSVSLKKKSSHSYTDLLGIPFSSATIRGMQSDKRSGKLLLPPKHHNQGGDSSDGLPFGVKIPRLTVDSTSSISTSSNQRQGNLKNENFHGSSRNQAVLLYATNMMNQHTYPSEKAISNSSRKSGRLRCVHSEFHSMSRHGSVCKCESSTSSSSSSDEYSLSPEFGRTSPASCEDLANDEQSDFPAEESMPCKNRRAFMSSHARFLKYHIGTGGPRHLKHSELLRLLNVSGASGDGRNDVDRDSELEEIFNSTCSIGTATLRAFVFGTWPYLSRRAKLGYTKGVSQSGMRNWNTAGGADKPVTARNKKAVIFVPSKLDSCGSVGQPSAGLAAGTWPYLSRRAKLGYTKGVSQAGMRNWNTAGGADKPVTARNKKAVIFVPSKLDSCGSVGQPSAGLAVIRGSGPRVPTPPWLAADDEVEEDASTITGSSSSPCRSKGCESNHPGLGYFTPELCEISPMNETNLGHRLLQRLGWEPGQGLGANNHGLLDPVGCVPHSSSPSFLYPVAST